MVPPSPIPRRPCTTNPQTTRGTPEFPLPAGPLTRRLISPEMSATWQRGMVKRGKACASDTCGQAERMAAREQAAATRPVPAGLSRPQPAVPAAACRPRHPRNLAGLDQPAATRLSARAWRCARAAPTCATAPNRPSPMMNWAHARRTAPGRRHPLVHEHRHDLGDDGQDQPTVTACFSGKSQPWNCRSSILQTDGGASGTRLKGRAFFLLSGSKLRSRPGIHGCCRRRRSQVRTRVRQLRRPCSGLARWGLRPVCQ
jgi:hypothetical protein